METQNDKNFSVIKGIPGVSKDIYIWDSKIPPVEEKAIQQLKNIAACPFVTSHIAVMPDVHLGKGATIGSVIPTVGAVIPAAVGVDIGCGMMAVKTTLKASDLPDNLRCVRLAIEEAVPHGRTSWNSSDDKGSWKDIDPNVEYLWDCHLKQDLKKLCRSYPQLEKANSLHHLGTLGTGNHFIEVSLDQYDSVWVVLHSGSRGIGNAIGQLFIELAKKDMGVHLANLPDKDLAYLKEGTSYFNDYVFAVSWAQKFAAYNRALMMDLTMDAIRKVIPVSFRYEATAINCHHNYIDFRSNSIDSLDRLLTRKGAISAEKGQLGIIPGSMGDKTYIVVGKGSKDSFCSCSHGAGRMLSRNEAKKKYTIDDQEKATAGIECRKDEGVIDEIPMAYKSIDAVMESQTDLVSIVHTLRQVVNVKG